MESFLTGMGVLHTVFAAFFAIGVNKMAALSEHLSRGEKVAAEEGYDPLPRVEMQRDIRSAIFLDFVFLVGCLAWMVFWFLNINHVVLAVSSMVVPAGFAVGAIRAVVVIRRS